MNTGILIINILLLIGEIILGFILLFGKSYLQKKGENTADKEDSQEIAMLAELGKNIATKQDIQEITDKVESIKASYNESLERHKIELQKEFEAHKYTSNLCNSLDKLLLELISACLKAEASEECYSDEDNNLISTTCKLVHFLNTYRKRYESNESIKKLSDISNKINLENEHGTLAHNEYSNGHISYKINRADKDELLECLEATLSLFLPPFKENKPE